jgi:hypothetical protein
MSRPGEDAQPSETGCQTSPQRDQHQRQRLQRRARQLDRRVPDVPHPMSAGVAGRQPMRGESEGCPLGMISYGEGGAEESLDEDAKPSTR